MGPVLLSKSSHILLLNWPWQLCREQSWFRRLSCPLLQGGYPQHCFTGVQWYQQRALRSCRTQGKSSINTEICAIIKGQCSNHKVGNRAKFPFPPTTCMANLDHASPQPAHQDFSTCPCHWPTSHPSNSDACELFPHKPPPPPPTQLSASHRYWVAF